jgi:uncharacterized protein (DUF433 family)
MTEITELLTAPEAAVVSSVSVRDIHRVIDESILPDEFVSLGNGRHVMAAGCSLISFYFESAKRLTAEQRLAAIRTVGPRLRKPLAAMSLLKEDWIIHDDFLTIDLAPFLRKTCERLHRLEEARQLVVTSPDILSGMPVIRGTRIPVYDLAASVTAGIPIARILAAYPSLNADKIELAAIYAEANPQRGRPRYAPTLPKGAKILSDRRVPRRRTAG